MFKWVRSKIESAFQELAEAQKNIDESARKVVESITRRIDVALDEAPSSRAALPGHDFTWYDQIAGALASEGFGSPVGVEPRSWLSQPVESRALTEYAVGDGGGVVASWFQMPPRNDVPGRRIISLTTATDDGQQFATVQNVVRSDFPLPPTTHVEYLDEQTALDTLLTTHRARVAQHGAPPRLFANVATYQEWQRDEHERTARFRREQGLSLIERYIETRFSGDSAEVGREYLQSIRAHPEWYKYSAGRTADAPTTGTPAAASPSASTEAAFPLNFLMSATDDGRRVVTTFGMLFAGLPELLARGVAANQSRAARFLLATVARSIARRRAEVANDADLLSALVSRSGIRIELAPGDAAEIAGAASGTTRASGGDPVHVHVSLQGFDDDNDEPSLLGIDPLAGAPGSFDERLRELCARLGCDVPVPALAESMEDAMHDAHLRARAELPKVRSRYQGGIGPDEKVCVKVRVVEGDAGEYVWLEVRGWAEVIEADVITPAPRIKLANGQRLTITEDRVYDYIEIGPGGMTTPAVTDLVAMDYGMDI